MKDPEIRRSLRRLLRGVYADQPDTLIVDELGLCTGRVRADVVVVNGLLSGFEIKSDSDTLARLGAQAEFYGRVFDCATVVVADRFVNTVIKQLPEWWGVQLAASGGRDEVRFLTVRPAERNPALDPAALAQLLWRDEVVDVLEAMQQVSKACRAPRHVLWQMLGEALSLDDLRQVVRAKLKARPSLRVGLRRRPSGAMYRPFATSSGYLAKRAD
jgi:hypothetical protein